MGNGVGQPMALQENPSRSDQFRKMLFEILLNYKKARRVFKTDAEKRQQYLYLVKTP